MNSYSQDENNDFVRSLKSLMVRYNYKVIHNQYGGECFDFVNEDGTINICLELFADYLNDYEKMEEINNG